MRYADAATADPTVSTSKYDAMTVTPHEESSGYINRPIAPTVIIRSAIVSSSTMVRAVNQSNFSAEGTGRQKQQTKALSSPEFEAKPTFSCFAAPLATSETQPLTMETQALDKSDNDKLAALAIDLNAGIAARVAPVLVEDCTGGVYLLRTRSRRLAAVFKPADEEPYAPNNPKKFRLDASGGDKGKKSAPPHLPTSIRVGIPAGQAAIREVAAYLLDHKAFAGVPLTTIATVSLSAFHSTSRTNQSKRGSLQVYVPHKCTADDIAVSFFDTASIHAVAVLDIRLANQDRHGGNLLVVEEKSSIQSRELGDDNFTSRLHRLVPIDHGACLPSITALDETSFSWLFWPQARQPFDKRTLDYIKALDAFDDQDRLAKHIGADELDPQALLTLHICTALLQVCALDWHMTAQEIGLMMTRQATYKQSQQELSVLERLVTKASYDVSVGDAKTGRLATTLLVQSFRKHLTDHLHANIGAAKFQ